MPIRVNRPGLFTFFAVLVAFAIACTGLDASAAFPTNTVRVEGQKYERTMELVEEGKPVRARLTIRHRYKDGMLHLVGKTNMRPKFFADITIVNKETKKDVANEQVVISEKGRYASGPLAVIPGTYLVTASVEIAQLKPKDKSEPLLGFKINSSKTKYYCGPQALKKKRGKEVVNDLRGGGLLGGQIVTRNVVRSVIIAHPPSGSLVVRDKEDRLVRVEIRKDIVLEAPTKDIN